MFWLIQLFFVESIKNNNFHRDLLVFPLVLTETLAECPLIQLFFSYSFFLGAEIYKLKAFKNLPFDMPGIIRGKITINSSSKSVFSSRFGSLRVQISQRCLHCVSRYVKTSHL